MGEVKDSVSEYDIDRNGDRDRENDDMEGDGEEEEGSFAHLNFRDRDRDSNKDRDRDKSIEEEAEETEEEEMLEEYERVGQQQALLLHRLHDLVIKKQPYHLQDTYTFPTTTNTCMNSYSSSNQE